METIQQLSPMEAFLALCVGLGLSASCGFRVFVPLFIASLSVKFGVLPVAENMEWVCSPIAMICLGTATIVELSAFYIPIVDHFLDTIAAPSAMIAGTLMTVFMLTGTDPAIQWGLGIILGGGTAGVAQMGTSMVRLGSTATTGGVGNPLVATLENLLAFVCSLIAIWFPIIAFSIIVLSLGGLIYWWMRRRKKKAAAATPRTDTKTE